MYNKLKLISSTGEIIINHTDCNKSEDSIFLILRIKSFNKINSRDNFVNFDDYYETDDKKKYKIQIKVTGRVKTINKKLSAGTISLRSNEKIVKRSPVMNPILFTGKFHDIRFEILIPQKALWKFVDVKEGPNRIGHVKKHHHINCGVKQVVSGGKVSPK